MTLQGDFYLAIACLSLVNFIRVFLFLIGADIYDIKQILQRKHRSKRYRPFISIIIPAYNEQVGVIRTIKSIIASSYSRKEILVVNDGSTDRTKQKLRNFQKKYPGSIRIINQPNAGKAAAINNAISKSKGSLIMVVDADSLLDRQAIEKMVAHFQDKQIIAAASNVKILPTRKLMGIAQRFEYLISYRMKRALNTLNVEYIVGGVGSTFRKRQLLKVGGYDTDTMTEDIDLTVKLIRHYGNTKYKIHYAADSIAFTEHVLTFPSLVKQRFRWKYGRFQTLMKSRSLFFSRSDKYDKRLTWLQLPYALFGEAALLIEPMLVGYILFITVRYTDLSSMMWVYGIVSLFVFLMILGEESEKIQTKAMLSCFLPLVYVLMYILTAVEFIALIKSLRKIRALITQAEEKSSWEHVERIGEAVSL